MKNVTPAKRVILTVDEEAFVHGLLVGKRAEEAYRAAFDCSRLGSSGVYTRAMTLKRSSRVAERMRELQNVRSRDVMDTRTFVKTMLMSIILADPNELIAHKRGACVYCYGEDHKRQWTVGTYAEASEEAVKRKREIPDCSGGFGYDFTAEPHPHCPECKGFGVGYVRVADTDNLSEDAHRLFAGVKQTKDGLQIQMVDKMKAIELLGRVDGIFTDKADIRMTGALRLAFDVARFDPNDPEAHARAYKEMIQGAINST